ncbi:MAG TPA: TM0106 family RecB-like putative nuclease [Acidimicrobiia bacterium]|jgi:uncharacterized protein
MRVLDGEPIFSASDLVGFAACAHLTQLELAAARGEIRRPNRDDPLLDIMVRRGEAHEAALLEHEAESGRDVVTVSADTTDRAGLVAAARDTEAAMRAGAPVIYQAAFLHDGWVGHADFVERVDDVASDFGSWSYEVADAKLTRTVRASALLQLCEYSAHVARLQGRAPDRIHVITGDEVRHSFRLADYAAYHRTLKAEFLATAGVAASAAATTYPEPVEHCSICRWWGVCRDRRRADDHLSLVAGVRGEQRRRMHTVGIDTRAELAHEVTMPAGLSMSPAAFATLHAQAALQVRGDGCEPPLVELIEPAAPEPGVPPQGLAILPAASTGDLFLDLEGDPYAADGGLEYLFGLVDITHGAPEYHAFWGHTKGEERVAFEAAVDLIVEYRRRWPDMHVYHYAPHEPSAFKRLMGEHGTREEEIDDLLRGNVFVDLYRAVRQGVRLSVESYSLKTVETLYFERPDGAVMTAGSSIVTYERYLETGDGALLDEIAAYNRDDCESLIGLREWLEARRSEAIARFGPIERPAQPEVAPEVVDDSERAELARRLLDGVPEEPTERGREEQARYLLAHLLEWHRREVKPAWWRYFERVNVYEPDDFVRDSECIGGLAYEGVVGTVKRSLVHRFRFEAQDHKFRTGHEPLDPGTQKSAGTIMEIGDDYVDLKRGRRSTKALPHALMPGQPYFTTEQREAIADVARWVLAHGIDAPGDYRAVRDLLLARPPRPFDGVAPRVAPGDDIVDAATRLTLALDGGCLPVQGPPGAGKTFTGARMIVAALEKGRKVGIAATTHNAITNLLAEVAKAAAERRFVLHGMQGIDGERSRPITGIECVKTDAMEAALLGGAVKLAAGTSWFWARAGMRDAVDLLFVDEAGQMSLADAVAVGTAARNLVLLGDPQQLAQPSTGSHPNGAGASALDHVLGDHSTIPDSRGLFLPTTFRMHPNVCRFISEVAYDDRLYAAPGRERQLVDGAAGVWFVPVQHDGDSTRSSDEAEAVAGLFDDLLGKPWIDWHGVEHSLTVDDLIVVAPYNAHVAELHRALPAGVEVGTVDKFQGREGVVAVYSMASSSADEAPRGMGFLYDLHRLNVAVSRARARAYVVASPRLLHVLCHNPEQLRLANALCRYVEYAAHSPT